MRTVSLITIFLLFFSSKIFVGCANIIPPSGGPRDSIPPVLMNATPKDSSVQFKTNKIVLTFNEFVELQNVQENVIVSPTPQNTPQIDFKLRTVSIKIKDSLEANTTYSINFGKAIKDINEGNVLTDFKYIFSTGNAIDTNSISGNVILAETGKIDSTLLVVLHSNLSDTAITKLRPRYYTKLDKEGKFTFTNLPKKDFSIFVIPNDYSKKYDDNTKLFAFTNKTISATTNTLVETLYAFEEEKKIVQPSNLSNTISDKSLKYSTSLDLFKLDFFKDLQLTFNHKIKKIDSLGIKLLYNDSIVENNISLQLDTSQKIVSIKHDWKKGENYQLILLKNVVTDSANNTLPKSDSIRFTIKTEEEYGNVQLRFNNLDTTLNPVLLIMQGNKIIESSRLAYKTWSKKLFPPGDYEIKILYDKNNNGVWDTGHFLKEKKQPEIVKDLNIKLNVRANWDNEKEINL